MVKGINGTNQSQRQNLQRIHARNRHQRCDTAAVATYIMNAFDNGGGSVTEKDVKQAKGKKTKQNKMPSENPK